jgi:hypothetical protein
MTSTTQQQTSYGKSPGFQICRTIPPEFTFSLAKTRDELERAFRLAHDSYAEAGLMRPQPSGMRVTSYMLFPESSIVVAKHHEKIIASVAIIRDTEIGLPHRNITALSSAGSSGTIAEASNLAISSEYRQSRATVGLPLFRYGIEYATRFHRADSLVAVIHPRHADYFERVLLFSRMHDGVIPEYDFVAGAPAVVEQLPLRNYRERLRAAYRGVPDEENVYRFFFETDVPNLIYPKRPLTASSDCVWTPELLSHFLHGAAGLWTGMSTTQRAAMRNAYRGPEYDAVFA